MCTQYVPELSLTNVIKWIAIFRMEAIAGGSKELTTEEPTNTQDVPVVEKPKKAPRRQWKCHLCDLQELYDYKGNNPPFSKHLTFSEECYIMKDPFSPPNRGEIVTLGADCSICENPVCMECSFFYSKRFCKQCALKNIDCFPKKLRNRISVMSENNEEDS